MSNKKPEADIEAYFVKQVEEVLGGEALKLEVKGRRGWPDRLVLLPHGKVHFVELKSKKGGLNPLQEQKRAQIDTLGHFYWVVNSKRSVDRFCDICAGRLFT